MKRFFWLLSALFAVSFALAQIPVIKFRHLTSEHDLSETHVISLRQDHQGFIWICTDNGLNMVRYALSKNFDTQRTIIVMRAKALAGDKEMCLEARIDDYISKPVKLEWLLNALQKQSSHLRNNRLCRSYAD